MQSTHKGKSKYLKAQVLQKIQGRGMENLPSFVKFLLQLCQLQTAWLQLLYISLQDQMELWWTRLGLKVINLFFTAGTLWCIHFSVTFLRSLLLRAASRFWAWRLSTCTKSSCHFQKRLYNMLLQTFGRNCIQAYRSAVEPIWTHQYEKSEKKIDFDFPYSIFSIKS